MTGEYPRVEIPEVLVQRLNGLGPRFVKVEKMEKRPFEDDWQKPENLMYADDPRLQEWLRKGGNYGIAAGYGLAILNADHEEIKQIVESKFPSSLTVESPGHKAPVYFFLSNLTGKMFLRTKGGEHAGEILWEGFQTVGPGSVHPNGQRYRIDNDAPLATISKELLAALLGDHLVPEKQIREVEEAASKEKQQAGVDLGILQVVPLSGLRKQGDEYYGVHPVHGSETGRNFWVNPAKNVWYCFRHGTGGGAALWLAVQEGIIRCEDAGPGALRRGLFKQVLHKAVERGLIRETQLNAKKQAEGISLSDSSRKRAAQEKEKEEIDPEIRLEAVKFLEDPCLLYRIHNAQGNVQGEDNNKVLLPILNWAKQSFEIEGETAAGKNTIVDSVLSLFPKSSWEKATGLTDKALRYLGETLRTLYLAERRSAKTGEESTAEFDVKLVISEGELMVLVTISDPEDPKRFKTERIRTKIENVILTSTELAIPPELQNRLWVVRADESKEQNIRVRDAKLQGKERLPSERLDFSREKKIIQAAFGIAEEEAPKDVVIPHATLLTPLLDEKETRVRRDTDKLTLLIEGITRLFYRQRPIILNGGDRKVLVSTPEDFWIAWKIGETAIKETFADMTEKDVQVLKWCKELDKDQKQITTKTLAELTKRTDSTCYKWLRALQSKGFLVEESRGSHGLKVYCLQSSDRAQVGIERIPIWQLQERYKNWLLARKEPKTSFLKQSFRSEKGEMPTLILIDPIEGIKIDLPSFRPETLEEKPGNQTPKAEISSISSSEKITRSESDLIRPSEEDWKNQHTDFFTGTKQALKATKPSSSVDVCYTCWLSPKYHYQEMLKAGTIRWEPIKPTGEHICQLCGEEPAGYRVIL